MEVPINKIKIAASKEARKKMQVATSLKRISLLYQLSNTKAKPLKSIGMVKEVEMEMEMAKGIVEAIKMDFKKIK